MKVKVKSLSNKEVDEVELDSSVFDVTVRKDIMARVVKWQLSNRRLGNHKAKNRAEVNHSTKKPFRQKGTGRARQGMSGVSQMRGGGVVFGPVVRDHSIKLQKKVRVLGLKSAISSKVKEGKIIILDHIKLKDHKTATLKKLLDVLKVQSALFVDSNGVDENFKKACSNIIKIDVIPQIGLNVYDILNHDNLVFTQTGVKELMERLNGK